ncbi:hypothetical protein ID866_3194 [Astraeus odoratus]|nr:hypothetical protein ID866_3194 [Astraeus odoratus]
MEYRAVNRMNSPSNLRRATSTSCVAPTPTNTLTDRLNNLLTSSGSGYVLSLCPGEQYPITAPLLFTAPNQEISTAGYPTDDTRATLIVSGPVFSNGTGHTTAVDGTCNNCEGVKLRNVQVNGTRLGALPLVGGANIEMGGSNSNHLVEYVHSYDPRSWSCLHIFEGNLTCNNATVQYNDIGPAGSDLFGQWADGISVACRNSFVKNNMINNPTDGGIVLFGSPGTRVENNTIWVETNTLLGGINMVDIGSFDGNYTGVVVTNNTIAGGFADGTPTGSQTKGTNNEDVIIKIGIAIGPRTWFGNHYGNNVSLGGTVLNNQLTGAFSYGIAMSSAKNFTVEGNVLVGNTSFIGARGPNCSADDPTPSPAPFIIDLSTVSQSTTQLDFTPVSDGDSLTCVQPPDGGDYWPYGGNPNPPEAAPTTTTTSTPSSHTGTTVGIIIGSLLAVAVVGVAAWYIRRWAIKRAEDRKILHATRQYRDHSGYLRSKE